MLGLDQQDFEDRIMARMRSPNYPHVSLDYAIGMAGKIHSVDRTHSIEREVAAQHLGYTGITGPSGKMLASLIQYGLLEKVAKNEVRVSDTAVEILYPDDPTQKEEALRRAAFFPQLFSNLRDRFPDGAPSEGSLRSYLMKQGFSDQAIGRAANAYLKTFEFIQQNAAYESYDLHESVGVKSKDYQSVEDRPTMQASETRTRMPLGAVPRRLEDVALNDINVEIFGQHVRINVLLDSKGLDKLKRKIEALQTLISDDESDGAANDPEDRQDSDDEHG